MTQELYGTNRAGNRRGRYPDNLSCGTEVYATQIVIMIVLYSTKAGETVLYCRQYDDTIKSTQKMSRCRVVQLQKEDDVRPTSPALKFSAMHYLFALPYSIRRWRRSDVVPLGILLSVCL